MRFLDQTTFYFDLYTHYLKYHHLVSDNNSSSPTIPKIIHYCWFGSEKFSPIIERCVDSWKRVLPEYEIMLWNESNFNIDENLFAKQAYAKKKFQYVSDVARLKALHKYGGIYLDTDVEIFKPLDAFLNHGAFASYECDRLISTAVIGAKQNNNWIKLFLSWYEHVEFRKYYEVLANTKFISKISPINYGVTINGNKLHFGDDVHIYPVEYFGATSQKEATNNTFCLHYAHTKYQLP